MNKEGNLDAGKGNSSKGWAPSCGKSPGPGLGWAGFESRLEPVLAV